MKVSRMDGKMQEMDVRKVWAEVFGQAVENRTRKLLATRRHVGLHA